MFNAKLFLNLANCIYTAGYLVRDVLLLRMISICGMITIIPYFMWFSKEGPMIEAICWNFLFLAINVYWVVKILLERQPPKFTPDQRRLYEFAFHHSCTPREMLQLLEKGTWKESGAGERILQRGAQAERLIVIHEGNAGVEINGREIARLRDGDLVGEMSFMTNERAVADVIARGPLKYVVFEKKELDSLFEQRVHLQVAVQRLIGQNLVDRLTSSLPSVPELSVDRPQQS